MIRSGKAKKLRLVSLILALFMVILVVAGSLVFQSDFSRFHHHMEGEAEKDRNNGMECFNYDFTVNNLFRSHLPIIIIDVDERDIKTDTEWDSLKGYRVPLGIDPYGYGKISIIDNKYKVNTITDEADVSSDVKIKLRGNSSLVLDKKQYMAKTIYKEGDKRVRNIMGLGKEWEWIINISMADKSLLRNYMCMNIAAEIMPNTPDVRFCEVIFKKRNSYHYRGVYLLMESIKRDKNRVNIQRYKKDSGEIPYLLKRDRYDEEALLLDTYGRTNGLSDNYLELKYPYEITENDLYDIESEISSLERALYSSDQNEFYKYQDYIDRESFINYFIINEFFGNYDSGYQSMYYYKDIRKKISIGPVWDFDRSMDNFNEIPARIDSTAMHDGVWFKQLLRDETFVRDLITRYHELRKTILSEKFIEDYIDNTIRFLGPSQTRDWAKWGYFYEDPDVEDERRQKVANVETNYEDEIIKMKNYLRDHGKWLDENIESLYQFSEFKDKEISRDIIYRIGEILFGDNSDTWSYSINGLIFIMIFIISIVLIQRE
jgi:hypothetical protein